MRHNVKRLCAAARMNFKPAVCVQRLHKTVCYVPLNSELIYDYDQRLCIENDITLAGGDIYYDLKYKQ